ncbi:MAG: hypothetical protein AAF447_21415 [Myxococcota bacterium]
MRNAGPVLLALSALASGACSPRDPTPPPAPASAPVASGLAAPREHPCAAPVPLGPDVHRGLCLAHSYAGGGARGYGSASSAAELRRLRDLGATWVSLTPFGYQDRLDATRVRGLYERGSGRWESAGETDERLVGEIRAAHGLGLKVLLKPHLWVGRGAWRAEIDPGTTEGWRRWQASYGAFLQHYAELASREGVALLAVGTELRSSALRFPDWWRRLVRQVRAVYDGELTYAANWDEAEQVTFWRDLDYVGVNFYPSLAETPEDPEDAKRRRLEAALDRLDALAARTGRPLLLTEVGYKSCRGTEVRPYEWTERIRDGDAPDEAAQARAYRRLLRAVAQRPHIRGVYVWKWFTDPASREEGPLGFSPRGKPAEDELRAAFGACASRAARPATTPGQLSAPAHAR